MSVASVKKLTTVVQTQMKPLWNSCLCKTVVINGAIMVSTK